MHIFNLDFLNFINLSIFDLEFDFFFLESSDIQYRF